MTAYDDELGASIGRWRAQCIQIEAQIQSDVNESASPKAVVEQATRLRKLQTGIKSMVAITKHRRAAAVNAKAATRLMQELAEVTRRFEALQREIDGRLASL